MAAKKTAKAKIKTVEVKKRPNYELVVVLAGSATTAKKKQVQTLIEKLVSVINGKVLEVIDWGVRDLAYPISDNETGTFLIFDLDLKRETVPGFSDKVRLEDQIDRFLVLRKETRS